MTSSNGWVRVGSVPDYNPSHPKREDTMPKIPICDGYKDKDSGLGKRQHIGPGTKRRHGHIGEGELDAAGALALTVP